MDSRPGRADASRVQFLRDRDHAPTAARADALDEWNEVGRKAVGFRLLGIPSDLSGLTDVCWVTKGCALCLLGSQGTTGAFGDQAPFLFGQGGVQVQHERVGVRAELG